MKGTFKNSKIIDLQKKINDLERTKNVIQNQQFTLSQSDRKKRTRTLIQAGALLNMIGFFDLADIQEGDDLEMDMEHKDKAAILIGMLESFKTSIPPILSDEEKDKFKNIGIRVLKMRAKN